MRSASAHVQNGRIVLDDPTHLAEGTEVEVFLPAKDDDFEMTPEELEELDAELTAGEEEIARGEFVEAEELFARLEAKRR